VVALKASVVELRYKMSEVLSALERNESVEILYHGKVKGIIRPAMVRTDRSVREHRFFGMYKETQESVDQSMDRLRKPRYE
jgi:hypothetical protein